MSDDQEQSLQEPTLTQSDRTTGTLAPQSTGQPSSLDSVLPPRHLLADRFELVRLIGAGGMGTVYLARDQRLGRTVAIKTLRTDRVRPTERKRWLARFHYEAAAMARLQHPNILTIHDYGVADDLPFLVLEHLQGRSLRWLMDQTRLPIPRLVHLAIQLCEALDHAHKQDIVHRDLKPDNLFIHQGDRLKVLDFGIATLHPEFGQIDEYVSSAIQSKLTSAGTPRYMAPEQLLGDEQDGTTDLWAVGVLLFEALVGNVPFAEPRATLDFLSPVPDVAEIRSDVPPALAEVVAWCLQRQPDKRCPNAGAALARLRALDSETLDSASSTIRRRLSNLPATTDRFFGRQAELRELSAHLGDDVRIITLLGPGGIGKTRLALELGRRALDKRAARTGSREHPALSDASRDNQEVFFCELANVRDAEGVAAVVLRAMDVPLTDSSLVEQASRVLGSRSNTLLILDNFEQLTSASETTVGRWARAAPGVTFVVTSQHRLDLRSEVVCELSALLPDDEASLDDLRRNPGVALFCDRAEAAGHRVELDDTTTRHLGELVRLLDGLPLAIELAACRAAVLTPGQIVERLGKSLRLLRSDKVDVPARQRTLHAALDWSWNLLDEAEKATLAQLSVFVGGFSLESAEEVVSLDDHPDAPFVMDVLDGLVRKSMVVNKTVRLRQGPTRRFALLTSVGDYASQRLDDLGLTDAKQRHAEHFARFGTDSELERRDRHGGIAYRETTALELENVVTATEWALANGKDELAAHLAIAAGTLLLVGPHWRGAELLGRIPDTTLPDELRCRLLSLRAALRSFDEQHEAAGADVDTALSLARGLGDARLIVIAARTGGLCATEVGDTTRSGEFLQLAFEHVGRCGDRANEGRVYGGLATSDFIAGRLEEARKKYRRAIDIAKEVGDVEYEVVWSIHCTWAEDQIGTFENALQLAKHALARAYEVGNPHRTSDALGTLGILHMNRGQYEAARPYLREAGQICESIGDRRGVAIWAINSGMMLHRSGHAKRAETLLRGVLDDDTLADEYVRSGAIMELVNLLAKRRGRGTEAANAEARELCTSALGIARERNHGRRLGEWLVAMGLVHCQAEEWVDARHCFDEAETHFGDSGMHRHRAVVELERVDMALAEGNPDLAKETFVRARELVAALPGGADPGLVERISVLEAALVSGTWS